MPSKRRSFGVDKYSNYAALVAAERQGLDFEIVVIKRVASRVAVIAPHAGGIEPQTGPIARAIAGPEFSLYSFRGTKKGGNHDLHITSHHFDEPRCLKLISDQEWVVAIHGCENEGEHIFLSGLDESLIMDLEAALLDAGIVVQTSGHKYTARLPDNICNRGASNTGVQFEISRSFREGNRLPAFVKAVRTVLLERQKSKSMKWSC